jgi:hypothetical protein
MAVARDDQNSALWRFGFSYVTVAQPSGADFPA